MRLEEFLGLDEGGYISPDEAAELNRDLAAKKISDIASADRQNVLDYLLKNSQLIPEEWKGKAVFFWGTIFRDSDGSLYVRYLHWSGASWQWRNGCRWLGNDFLSCNPSALAS